MNNRPDFAKTQRDKENQRKFLRMLEYVRSYLSKNLKLFINYDITYERKSYCPHISERPLDFLQRCYIEACNSMTDDTMLTDANNLADLFWRMKDCIDGTEELEAENDLYRSLFIDDSKASSFLQLRPNERAFSLFAQYTPFKDEPKLLSTIEKIEMRFLRECSTERIYKLTIKRENYLEPQTDEIMKTLAPLTTIARSIQDVANILTDPLVSLTNQAPTVAYGENLLDTLKEYLTKLDHELWNNFSSVVEIRYAEHDEFSRRKRRLSSAVRNLQQIVAAMDGDVWLKTIKAIGLTETDELIDYLRKTLMPESDFNVDCQYNPIVKAPEILGVINAIWDRYLYWLINEKVDEPLAVFTWVNKTSN